LRLIGTKPVARDGKDPQKHHRNEEQGRRSQFVRVRQTEIIGDTPR